MKPNAHHPTSEELFAYRDGELTPDRRSVIEAHVLACAHCREQIDEMSALESDLKLRADAVGDEYYERMTESVLLRVAAADLSAEEAVVDAMPRLDRRRPDAAEMEGGARRRLRLPWIGIAGTGAAALAVALVAVLLLNRQEDWVRAPRPGVVGETKGRAPARDSDLAGNRARGEKGSTAADATRKDQAAEEGQGKKVAALQQARPTLGGASSELAAPENVARRENRTETAAGSAEGDETTPSAQSGAPSDARSEAPAALMRANDSAKLRAASPRAGGAGEAYASVLREHGLPVLWDESVPPEALLNAESDLRLVYQTHRAGADSARIRLYLAEAERTRLGDSADSADIQRIANHYRRAIGLARGDAALAAVARRRLAELLMTRPPAMDQPPTTP
jgi:Putative zinc-finger